MKKRYIILPLLLLSIAIYSSNIKSHAEDNCLKYHLGICIIPAPTPANNNTAKTSTQSNDNDTAKLKCKTMVDGRCTEYYDFGAGKYETQEKVKQNRINYDSYKNISNNLTETYISTVPRPEWYEFAPLEFENPEKCKGFYISFSCTDRNYWYDRKQNFEYYLSQCDRSSGRQRDICYSKLRDRELNLNTSYIPASQQFSNNLERQRQIDIQNKMIDAMTRPQQINVNGTMHHTW